MSPGQGRVLIVRHGRNRGRIRDYQGPFLDDLATRAPGLRERIHLHHTGEPVPELAEFGAVVFWLADPLRELYPNCYAEAVAIADDARSRAVRLVNPPEALSNSVKSVQAALWRDDGIPTSPHHSFTTPEELEQAIAATRFPAILRGDQVHSQAGMRFCRGPEDVRRIAPSRIRFPGSLAPFIDTREGYRERDPDSIWATLFHRKRAYVFGDVVRPGTVLFSDAPIVGRKSSTLFRPRHERRRWTSRVAHRLHLRGPVADAAYWQKALARDPTRAGEFELWRLAIDEDVEYSQRGPDDPGLLVRAVRALGLHFAAVDFSTLAGGGDVLWEANPHFNMPTNLALPDLRRGPARIVAVYDGMRAFLQALAAPPSDVRPQAT